VPNCWRSRGREPLVLPPEQPSDDGAKEPSEATSGSKVVRELNRERSTEWWGPGMAREPAAAHPGPSPRGEKWLARLPDPFQGELVTPCTQGGSTPREEPSEARPLDLHSRKP